jgi:hypothetical protein
MPWLAALLVLVQAFWQTKPPTDWNDIELAKFLADSPWARLAAPSAKGVPGPPVQIYMATAGPMEKAVAERNRRVALRRHIDPKAAAIDPLQEEFAVWFADNRAEHVILAARVGNNNAFLNDAETRRMQQECEIEMGRGKGKLSSYFPPTAADPYLYLAFPRGQALATDKTVTFSLYLPGVPGPFRALEFKIKDMLVDGKLEL